MSSTTQHKKPVGVVGAGSFGTAMSNLIAQNKDVLLYSRQKNLVEQINREHRNLDITMSPRIRATNNYEELATECSLIMPFVRSDNFRSMMKSLAPHLHPYHLIIHGTKGFDIGQQNIETIDHRTSLSRQDVSTMSEVILQESVVVRVGCLSGPNLAKEIVEGQPTATVIASRFEEVIKLGKRALNSRRFHVFGSTDIIGAEMAGALKNIIAIASGILGGLGMGKNIQALLITRGLSEMIKFGEVMGASNRAFFGTAGIGDLVATATSSKSRNYTFGYRMGQGESFESIVSSMPELAEGLRTLKISKKLAQTYELKVPIHEMLYRVVYEGFDMQRAIEFLIRYPYDVDVDFL